jgi:hypothetical protein
MQILLKNMNTKNISTDKLIILFNNIEKLDLIPE